MADAHFILLLITVVVLVAAVLIAQSAYYRWRRDKRLDYRARYRKLLYLLEQSTVISNQLESQVKMAEPEKKLVDYYLGTLGVLETLLRTVRTLDPIKGEPASLDTSLYLAQDLSLRCQRVKNAFMGFKTKRKVDYAQLFNQEKPGFLNVIGCYFCSRPYRADFFAHVRVKVQKSHMDVFACRVCEQELEHTKSVRILSFMQDGKSVHWSKVKGYQPSAEYWHLNLKRNDVVRQRPSLQLVKSEKMSSGESPGPGSFH